ncbi:hypothetical protein TELCIR_12716 [Teladorsagia circumcincta]|uniref:3-hydroxyisobutyryl-CoA hydrolase, mitochondrial n=1 Tax=Teladorsagia circumcincta TaxID=45464 RepID=A0A2G9U7D9_TELCI|nr:hypothetical protein TELCIR_12716 [Teladorsagia circumcincta]
MVREIYPRFREWEDAGDVDLIILKGSGEKAFCAGGDVLAVIKSAKEAAEGGTCTVHKDFFRWVFTMEYRLTQRSLEDHDFYEGCRAILIDKDRNPKWKPATLQEVPDEHIERYFAPLGREDIFLDDKTAKL